MLTSVLPRPDALSRPAAPNFNAEQQWFAAYTRSRHEKHVADELDCRKIESFLPLYDAIHQWKDRRAKVQLPLFPGYVFVHIALQDRLRVLELPGVAHLVGFGGHPTPLPDQEITKLRDSLAAGVHAEPYPFVKLGQRVRIKSGPFAGLEGILKHKKDNLRFVISIELIMRSIMLDIEGAEVEPV